MKTICALTLAAGLTYSTPSFTLDFCEGSNKEEWGNCYGDLPFENGDFYIGDINQGLSEGRDIYKFADGSFYVGQLNNFDRFCKGENNGLSRNPTNDDSVEHSFKYCQTKSEMDYKTVRTSKTRVHSY